MARQNPHQLPDDHQIHRHTADDTFGLHGDFHALVMVFTAINTIWSAGFSSGITLLSGLRFI
jgi:hypothetical protein